MFADMYLRESKQFGSLFMFVNYIQKPPPRLGIFIKIPKARRGFVIGGISFQKSIILSG